MPRDIAFLRAINAGRDRTIKMDHLHQIFERMGFSEVETFMGTGNVLFRPRIGDARELERIIEARLREELGYEASAFIRTEAELAEIGRYEPFKEAEIDAGAEFNIIFLKDALDDSTQGQVLDLSNDTNRLHVHGREIYWLRWTKPGTANFTHLPLEKVLNSSFTIRGARTVKLMVERYVSLGE